MFHFVLFVHIGVVLYEFPHNCILITIVHLKSLSRCSFIAAKICCSKRQQQQQQPVPVTQTKGEGATLEIINKISKEKHFSNALCQGTIDWLGAFFACAGFFYAWDVFCSCFFSCSLQIILWVLYRLYGYLRFGPLISARARMCEY